MRHTFSVELKSKDYVKHLAVSNESHDRVLVEGTLGALVDVAMIEGAALEITGVNGIIRIDISEAELRRGLSPAMLGASW
jgi:hypothetical protein